MAGTLRLGASCSEFELSEIASGLPMPFDHVAALIANANYSIM
jgi:hypothetical protein